MSRRHGRVTRRRGYRRSRACGWRRTTRIAQQRGAIDQGLRARVEAREAERELSLAVVGVLAISDGAPLSAQCDGARGEKDLESQDDALGLRWSAYQTDRRSRQRVELSIEKFIFGRIRPDDANGDGGAGVFAHGLECTPASRRLARRPHRGTRRRGRMMRAKRVLIVGAGAREHALGAALASSGHEVLAAPGNPGTALVGRNVPVRSDDIPGLVDVAERERVDLVVVGPEGPLALGLVDALGGRGIRAFGPTRAAARLETSKSFMKRFCSRNGIPTAPYEVFDDADRAERHVRAHGPLVVKADGLAAGKGVVVAETTDEACSAIDRIMRKREFGEAGARVVLEQRLEGEEASFHVVSDGTRAFALASAQDHKRLRDGDRGPNTGGMGAYAPAPVVTSELGELILSEIVAPTLAGMAREGAPFRGALFVGLMIDGEKASVLEYNVRFGDPEAVVIAPLYDGDWFELLDGAARGDISGVRGQNSNDSALAVVMAAEGYPGSPSVGDPIFGLDAPRDSSAFVRHAGTTLGPDGSVRTSGGRVLAVGSKLPTLELAARAAYAAVGSIHWRGEQHRSDIGWRALESRRS